MGMESVNLQVREEKSPLYIMVKDKIRELVERDIFKPGSKLPRETELAVMFNVSRNTLREALRLAQNEGWVIQKHGVGTFISYKGVVEQGLEVLESIDSLSRRQKWQCGTEDLEIDVIPATEQLSMKLGVKEGNDIVRIRRVKTSDTKRIAYVEDYFPLKITNIDEFRSGFKGSVLDYFINRNHPHIDYAWTNITALHAGEALGKKLIIPQDSILMLAEEVLFDDQGNPFEYSLNYSRMDFFQFHIVRTLPSKT